MPALAARLWQWIGGFIVRGGVSAGANTVKGAAAQVGRYVSQGVTWVQGTKVYRATRAHYLTIKRKLQQNPRLAGGIATALGIPPTLLFVYDELVSKGEVASQDTLEKGLQVLNNVRNGTFYQNFSAELVQQLLAAGVTEQEITSSLDWAEFAIREKDPIFQQLFNSRGVGATPLQLLMTYELVAPERFSNAILQISEQEIGPVTASILSALSSVGAQFENWDGESNIPVVLDSQDLVPSIGSTLIPVQHSSSYPQVTGSYDTKCDVTNLDSLVHKVNHLEDLTGLSGSTRYGEPRLAQFLKLIQELSPEDVKKVYEVRHAVRR